MGPQEDYIETVFTCEGDINDPNLRTRLEDFQTRLKDLLSTDERKLILKKVEPWNSVRVTFNIPREAALRLKQLAQQGNVTLRQLGVLAVQIEGDQLISLTIAGRNNERTQLIFRTADDTVNAPNLSLIDSGGGPNNFGSPGPTNVQSTRKNIAEYLRQGGGSSIFDSLFPTQGGDNVQSISQIPSGRSANDLGDNPSFQAERSSGSVVSSHMPFQNKTPTGTAFNNYPSEYEQIASGLDKPPPPPYPQGSAWFNNVAKGMRGIPTTTSPLLVNLLQTDPALAGMSNFINSKMLPPPSDLSPPIKKKRKARKPKDKTGCETETTNTIQSLPNPVLSSYAMPTSGSSNNILPVPLVTQALAANTQPSVTFSKSVPSATDLHYVSSVEDMRDTGKLMSSQNKALSKISKGNLDSFHESTGEKIINPYTGLLEPMELSDANPTKNCIPYERLSPQGLKNLGVEQNLPSKEKVNHVVSHNKLHSNNISSVPTMYTDTSIANISLQQCSSEANSSQTTGSHNQGSDSLSVTMSVLSSQSSSLPNHNLVQSSPMASVSYNSDLKFDLKKTFSQTRTCSALNLSSDQAIYRNAVMHGCHKAVSTVVSSGHTINAAEISYSSHKRLSSMDHLKKTSPENLLNPSKNPAKASGSCLDRGVGVTSENSIHAGSIHDTHMQNDIGAVTSGCTETNSKVYYNDSGVGSSSERSDDTPSEPGDSDFKSGHNHIDEFSKTIYESVAQKQNLLNKSDPQIITVGYAMSHIQKQNEKNSNDVSNILAIDKALSHPALKNRKSEISKLNNDIDHQVAIHLLNKNKRRSPKHFQNEEAISALTKEHLQLLHQVDSMQYLKDNIHLHGYQEKPGQHGSSNSRLTVPGKAENRLSPTNMHVGARTPSPRLLSNHDTKESFEGNLCNKVGNSSGITPVSEVEALHNDLTSKLLEQQQNMSTYLSQKKNDRKTKSPVGGMNLTVSAAMEIISLENMMASSINSSFGKHVEGLSSQGILKNDILNNIKRPENLTGLNESDAVKISKSGAYKRRSPASAMLHPLPQQFYDPKKLTESVQKLVKPLISESASLPHTQRRSPGSVGTRTCTSPSLKGEGHKGSDSSDNVDNVIVQESDSVSNNNSHSVNSDTSLTSSSDLQKIDTENKVKNLNSSVFNHVLNEQTMKSNDLQKCDVTLTNNKEESGNHSIHSQENLCSDVSAVSSHSLQSGLDSSNKLVNSKSKINSMSTNDEQKNHRQILNESDSISSNISIGQSSKECLASPSKNEASKVPTNKVSPAIDESDENLLKNGCKSSSKKSENLCNTTGVEYPSLKVNCDSEKNSPKSSQKSPNLSPVKKGKSEESRPIKLHLSHGIITNPPYSKEELATETNITVITRSDPRKLENSAGEPTVPPLVLKVSRKPAVIEPQPEQKMEESQSLTMSLRARKASETTDTHTPRPPKPVRQKSNDQSESEQYKIVEDLSAKNLRQSRRRKTTSSENETGVDSDKKAHIENYVQENDHSEDNQSDISENLTLFDNVKSGLRARAQNKPAQDEKTKVSPKDLKQSKTMEEDLNIKRNSQNRRSRQSPTLSTEKQQTKETRDKSPGRISRTRSGQISPSVEDDNSKRSTRSAKPKNQTVDAQNDATEPLPPASKRRRTTSRDHR